MQNFVGKPLGRPTEYNAIEWVQWVGHMDRMGRGEIHTEFWWGNP